MATHTDSDKSSASLLDKFRNNFTASDDTDSAMEDGYTPASSTSDKASVAADEPTEHFDAGMKCDVKHLYSGKEDKRGRFQWQDTVPEDVGKPAEDAESAKMALIVRNVKVYNNPAKVLAIHSIVVQSPLLKKLLVKVVQGYPGVTATLTKLEFTSKFEPLIHRWSELKSEIAKLDEDPSEEAAETKRHAGLLLEILNKEFKDVIETSQDMKNKGVITYELLWTLFQPGSMIFTRQDGQDVAMKLHTARYGYDNQNNPVYWLTCQYIDFDGNRFGTNKINVSIPEYKGTRPITGLRAYPLDHHAEKDALRQRLVERGAKMEALAGSHYKSYHGMGWKRNQFGSKDKHTVKGRVVIDTYGWNRFVPNYAVFVSPLNQREKTTTGADGGYDDEDMDADLGGDFGGDDDGMGGMPIDGHFMDEDDGDSQRQPLTDEQKLICTAQVRGFCLTNKQWLNLFVNSVKDIEWSTGAFDRLVLPENQKELIYGFVESQRQNGNMFDDIIEGKGKGMILLLCGPPGVGKTLTSEAVAEEMHVPLYMMSAGDLGLDPRNVEHKLQNILEMCTRWNAILLLDEADVFLEERSLHELERNKLVSIFLRVLEYYEGIMFLTTNRVSTFDAAFQSRVHISLDYPELSVDSRRQIWKNFLEKASFEHSITEKQVDLLALMELNGRQIKNVLKTSQLLARHRGEKLGFGHVQQTRDTTQHLSNNERESQRARSALFA